MFQDLFQNLQNEIKEIQKIQMFQYITFYEFKSIKRNGCHCSQIKKIHFCVSFRMHQKERSIQIIESIAEKSYFNFIILF